MKAIFIRMRAQYIVGHLCPVWFRQYISPVNHRSMSSQLWRNVGREGAEREGSLTYSTFNRLKLNNRSQTYLSDKNLCCSYDTLVFGVVVKFDCTTDSFLLKKPFLRKILNHYNKMQLLHDGSNKADKKYNYEGENFSFIIITTLVSTLLLFIHTYT